MPPTADPLPASPAGLRVRGLGLLPWAARLSLRLAGWRFQGEFPAVPKFVAIIAPHTSNWDFVVGLLAKWALDLRVSWLGKHTLFRPPFGAFFRRIGGIPVDRSTSQGAVADCVRAFAQARDLMLALAPQGTRKGAGQWRSGFYRIAVDAGVPICPVGLDFRDRAIRFFPLFSPSGDYGKDLERLVAQFAPVTGLRARAPAAP